MVKLELEVLSYKTPHGLLLNSTCSSTIKSVLGNSHGQGPGGLRRCFVPTSAGVCYNPVMTLTARYSIRHLRFRGLAPGGSAGKETACNAGDLGSIPGLGRSPGEGNGYPLQYSGLENPYSPWGCKESDMTEQLSRSQTPAAHGVLGPPTILTDWLPIWGCPQPPQFENSLE